MVQNLSDKVNSNMRTQNRQGVQAFLTQLFLFTGTPDAEVKATMKPQTLLQKLWVSPFFWMLADAILINIAFTLAYYVRYELQWIRAVEPINFQPYIAFVPFMLLLTVLLHLAFRKERIYKNRRVISWFDEFYNIFNGTTSGILIMIVLVFFYQPTFYSRIIFLYAGAFILILLGLSRWIKVAALRYWRRSGFGVVRMLIIGAGEVSRTVMRAVVANPEQGYNIVGFLDDDREKGQTDIGRFKALGGINNLGDLLDRHMVDEVVITLPWQYHRKIMGISAICDRYGIRTRIVPDVFQMTLSNVEFGEIAGVPLIGLKPIPMSGPGLVMKRVIDFTVALLGLIFLSPLLALLALAIKLDSPGPAIFAQERVGKGGKRFMIYKFRSMVSDAEAKKQELLKYNEADGPLFKMKDDPRMTRLGRLMRKFSLDELLQLYNVLRGEMSLIGPRPNLPTEVAQYQNWHRRRLEIVPGITGLWQVSGRSDLTFDEMALLDIYYLENWSPDLDIKILLNTIPTILLRIGAY
ncbi:MAG: sugar transferase [Chloroflexota bacterium]